MEQDCHNSLYTSTQQAQFSYIMINVKGISKACDSECRLKMFENHSESIPSVSIIVPVYNGNETLALCLRSISDLDYPKNKIEIIVVDNGSTDLSVRIAESFGVLLLRETGIRSSYAARNKGILASKGELIAFTDADCIVTSGWLRHLVRDWDDATIGCFAGEIEAYKPKSLVERFSDKAGILRQEGTLSSSYLAYTQTANSAYRRDVFAKVGLFIPEMISGGDADISWRMQRQLGLKIKFIPDALVYHKHRTSLAGLYNQFRKYEHGKLLWGKYYSDFPVPTKMQRREELRQSLIFARQCFFKNFRQFISGKIDSVDLASPFLQAIIAYGTYRAHLTLPPETLQT